jgi:cytochrome P450
VAERRARPAGDLTSELVAAGDRDDRLDERELLVMLGLLLSAGFETTTNLIGNGVMALLRHPDELARWRADPGLTPTAVEELLRYDASVQVTGRSLVAPLTVGGAELEPGRLVIALLGAANHDPARFDDPDRLRLDRPGNRPLTFGGGIHYCLGAQLARLEAAVLFPALLGRFAAIEQAGPPVRRPSLALRGYLELPLALTPAGGTTGRR